MHSKNGGLAERTPMEHPADLAPFISFFMSLRDHVGRYSSRPILGPVRARIALRLGLSLVLTGFALAGGSARAQSAEPQIGQPAPDFTAQDSKGVTRHLSEFRGKPVVLEWTNADCPYTRKHYSSGNMQNAQSLAQKDGVVWLTIISSAPGNQGYVDGSTADSLTRTRGAAPTAVLLDPSGTVGRLYHARTTPHLYVVDRDGKLQYMGGMDSIATADVADIPKAEPYLKEAMLAVVDGKPVAHPVTKPYGCSIKY